MRIKHSRQSRFEASDIGSKQSNYLASAIRRAMNERAQFYRRKLDFYRSIQKLDKSEATDPNLKVRDAEKSLLSTSDSY